MLLVRGQVYNHLPPDRFLPRADKGVPGWGENWLSKQEGTRKEHDFEVHLDTPFRDFEIPEFAKKELGVIYIQFQGPKLSLFVPYSTSSHFQGTFLTSLRGKEWSLCRGSDSSPTNIRRQRSFCSPFRN